MPLVGASSEEPIRLFAKPASVPLKRAQVPPRLGTLAAVLMVILVIAAAALSFVDSSANARLASAGLEVAETSALRQAAPLDDGASRSPLLAQRVDYSQTFSGLSSAPDRVCASFAALGFETTGWRPSPVALNGWECSLTHGPDVAQGGSVGSSVFFMLRGSDADRISTLHLKINHLVPEEKQAVIAQALQILGALDGFADLAVPLPVTNAVSTLTPMDIATFAARFRFGAEKGDADRFNLTVVYSPRISGVLKVSDQALQTSVQRALFRR